MMKLFLKYSEAGFEILDESAYLRYSVSVRSEKNKQKVIIRTPDRHIAAEIVHKNLVVQYFSVRCMGRLFVFVPFIKEYFAFVIYGSTYRFLGDIAAGRFSLIDVDKSPIMTQKKCWGKFGDGFELHFYNEEQELFGLCCAVCAALYLPAADHRPQMVGEG